MTLAEVIQNVKFLCENSVQSDKSVKCPECEKNQSSVQWQPWMGRLDDHLIDHYRVQYFKKYVRSLIQKK